MKKITIIGIMLMMMSSCIKQANPYVKLTDDDAAAIPYELGQIVKFVDQNGNTLTYKVTTDKTYQYNASQYPTALSGGDLSHPAPLSIECYARTVILTCEQHDAKRLCFTIRPEKELSFFHDGNLSLDVNLYTTSPCTIDGIDYENVHHEILYSQYTGELLYDWYYNEECGLLQFKYSDKSLTRLP